MNTAAKASPSSAYSGLSQNVRVVTHDCRWCDATAARFSVHAPGCPIGERYAQVQQLGGVPMAPLSGAALVEFFR